MSGRLLAGRLALAFVAFVLLVARPARADDPDITASVDTQKLGLGEVLRLNLHAASASGQPSHPKAGSTPGFTVLGTQNSPSSQMSIINGRVSRQRALDVTWSLRADRIGTWSVGPVSVQVGATTYQRGPIRITIVPAGQAPPRAQPPADPFDPFGGSGVFDPFKGLMDQLNGQPREDTRAVDPKLALDSPRGSLAFLHATADATDVVVGQQVTVSMYLYTEPNVRDLGVGDVHEATAGDFVKKTLYEEDTGDKAVSRALVDGRHYNVRLLRKWALFPIKTGDLTVTPMELTLQQGRNPGDTSRKSEVLTIHVTEPPLDGRPPGYVLGDVGKLTLSAEVTPRDIEQDGAVGVTLTLAGTGNLPAMITPPAQAGIEWLTPEVHEKVGPVDGDRFGGSRTLSYVVRIHKSGTVRLGALYIPYWDPALRRYDTARADLGPINVKPSSTPASARDVPPDPFASVPDMRVAMGATRPPRAELAEAHAAAFWLSFAGAPLAFLVFAGLSSAASAVKERARERAESPETDLKEKLQVAEREAKKGDPRALLTATVRALQAAIVVYADVNVRDARGAEAKERLIAAGVTDAIAKRIEELLADCEAARFAPDAPERSVAEARWKTAKGAIQDLRRGA